MQWLVTTKVDITLEQLSEVLVSLGCHFSSDECPIPLDETEQAVEVEGPEDLPDKAKDEDIILQVYPNSPMMTY